MILSKKFCPKCGSEDVVMADGGITGGWVCKSCGYVGPVLEKTPTKEIKNKNDKP